MACMGPAGAAYVPQRPGLCVMSDARGETCTQGSRASMHPRQGFRATSPPVHAARVGSGMEAWRECRVGRIGDALEQPVAQVLHGVCGCGHRCRGAASGERIRHRGVEVLHLHGVCAHQHNPLSLRAQPQE